MPGPGGSRWPPGSGTLRCNACWGLYLAGKGHDKCQGSEGRATPPPRFHRGLHQFPHKDLQRRSLGERAMGPRSQKYKDVTILRSLTNHLSPPNNQGLPPRPPSPHGPHSEKCDCLVLTNNIVPEADGAESDEGKVEAFTEAPALHVAEDHGREDENDQRPQGQEQSQAQDLQQLGARESVSESTWKAPGLGRGSTQIWEWSWAIAMSLPCPADLCGGACILCVCSCPGPGEYLVRGISLVDQVGTWRLLWAWGSHLDDPSGSGMTQIWDGGRPLNYPRFPCIPALLSVLALQGASQVGGRWGCAGGPGVYFQP